MSRDNGRNSAWEFAAACAFLLFLPPLSYVVVGLSSMTLGLVSSCLLAIFLIGRTGFPMAFDPVSLVGMLFGLGLLCTTVFSIVAGGLLLTGIGLGMFFVVVMAAGSLTYSLRTSDALTLQLVIRWFCFAALLLGFLSVVPLPSGLGYQEYAKSVFPFSEPSHYVGWMCSFVLAYFVTQSAGHQVLILAVLLLLAVLIQTMLLFAFVLALYGLTIAIRPRFIIQFANVLLITGAVLLLREFDLSYFTSRLDFSEGSTNLTVLVYLQGWEEIFLTLSSTNGMGVGFQNLGVTPPGKYAELIFSILGEYKNRNDGGFLAVKIIGEFGIAGVAVVALYLVFFVRSVIFFLRLNRLDDRVRWATGKPNRIATVVSHAFVFCFFFDLFARSVGYFSFSMIAVFAGCFFLYCRDFFLIIVRPVTSLSSGIFARSLQS